MNTQSMRDKVLEAYQHGPEAVVELVVMLVGELTVKLEALRVQLESVSSRVAALEAENAALRARLGTNSRNSGKPPSSDGPGVKPHPKSQRGHSGRKPGGQPGHTGHTLRLVDEPGEVKVHVPSRCRACGQNLQEVPVIRRERRQ